MQSFGDLLVKVAQGVELTRSERDLMKDYADTFRRAKDEMYVSNSFKNTTLIEGVPEAPSDSKFYSRYNKSWEVTTYPHYYNLTSQVDGSETYFTIPEQCWNLVILINGLVQGEDDFVYDIGGFGFTLDSVLISGDVLEVLIFPGTPIAGLGIPYNSTGSPNLPVGYPGKDPVRLSWDRYDIHTIDPVLSAFSSFSGTIPYRPSFPTLLRFPLTKIGSPVTACYAVNGVTRVLTASLSYSPFTGLASAYFSPGADTIITGFEFTVDAAGPWLYSEAPAVNWYDIAFSIDLFDYVAVGTDSVMGSELTLRTCPAGGWKLIMWVSELSKFVALTGNNGSDQYMTSADGYTWVAGSLQSGSWTCMEWSPGLSLLVVLGSLGVNNGMTSPDGINWTPFSYAGGALGLAWSPTLGLFVSVGLSNMIRTSPDGTTWTDRTVADATNTWGDVVWASGLGKFIAIGGAGTPGNKYATSSDGITWETGTAAANSESIAYSTKGVIMAAKKSSPWFIASSNGTSWNDNTGTSAMNAIIHVPDLGFVAVGDGTFAQSAASAEYSASIENALLYGAE